MEVSLKNMETRFSGSKTPYIMTTAHQKKIHTQTSQKRLHQPNTRKKKHESKEMKTETSTNSARTDPVLHSFPLAPWFCLYFRRWRVYSSRSSLLTPKKIEARSYLKGTHRLIMIRRIIPHPSRPYMRTRSKNITLLTQSKSMTHKYFLECCFDHMFIQHHPSTFNYFPFGFIAKKNKSVLWKGWWLLVIDAPTAH